MTSGTYIKKITEKFEKLGLKVPKAGEKTVMEGLASVTNAKCAAGNLSNFKMTIGKYKTYAVVAGLATGIGAIGWYLLSEDKKEK